jgi:hypothetical protein
MNNSIVSIGQACALLQDMPQKIQAAAVELGIEPILKINLVDHFDESDIARIGDFLRERSDSKKLLSAGK